MFSGLTNQVSGFFAKSSEGDPTQAATAEDAVAQPVASSEPVAVEAGAENADKQSPTKASGGMFSNVTGKVSGWLPSSMPTVSMPSVSMPAMPQVSLPAMPAMPSIPGLRKTQPTGEEGAEVPTESAVEAQPAPVEKDDDDRSSATGGADSRPVSEKGSPTEEQAGAVGNVTHKVTAGAKAFGSFFSGVVNKAGDKIKETVKHNPILGEFNKEQEAFIKDQSGKNTDAGVCPWVGHKNEEKIKEEVLSLSADRRNFVRAPPAGSEFEFNYDNSYPVALALMSEDKALEQMRFDLVPKIITEENFWKNYFYRVSLIIQAGELGTLGTDDAFGKREDEDDETTRTKISKSAPKDSKKTEMSSKPLTSDENSSLEIQENLTKLKVTNEERRSESEAMKKTSTGEGGGDEEEWEKNLAAEDFEVVHEDVDSDLDDLK